MTDIKKLDSIKKWMDTSLPGKKGTPVDIKDYGSYFRRIDKKLNKLKRQ
jgi:hypothetical protein